MVKCQEDESYVSTGETSVSRRELAKLIKRKWGQKVSKSIDQSLWRLRYTPITWRNSYYNSATEETIEELEGFTILSKLKLFRIHQVTFPQTISEFHLMQYLVIGK